MYAIADLLVLAVLVTSVWVFFDAPNIGESRLWALGFLALWILAFPWYLAVRSRKLRTPRPVATGQWLPDPSDPSRWRWHDGKTWTRQTSALNDEAPPAG
jgi:hypothetical protein